MKMYLEGGSPEASQDIYFRDPIGFMLRAYREAGPIFKTKLRGLEMPVIAGKEANAFVWQNPDLWKYSVSHKGFGEQVGPEHVSTKDGQEHAARRALLRPGFDRKAAFRLLGESNAMIHGFVNSLAEGERILLNDQWALWILKMQAEMHLGTSLDDRVIKRVSEWEKQLIRGFIRLEGRHEYYDREEYRTLRSEGLALYRSIAAERIKQGPTTWGNDLLSEIGRKRIAENCLTLEGLANDIYFLLSAGVHNTANFVTWILIYIYWHPKWLATLREELDAWDPLDAQGLSNCETLKAIVMEVQRIRPTTFGHIRHVAADFEFMGEKIECGSSINHANTLCQFLDEFYEDPFTFAPERFLENRRFIARTHGFYGGGTHICLGRHHTELQQLYVVAQIVREWDFEADFEPDFKISLIGSGTQHERDMAGTFHRRN